MPAADPPDLATRGSKRSYVLTLGCPKNQVDSDKLEGTLRADGYEPAGRAEDADLVVVNTCAFIEAARQESIETILDMDERRRPGARLVVTGCLAERHGDELADALPEVDLVAGFGVPVTLGRKGSVRATDVAGIDLLELPRPAPSAPWAYVKVAEGCDRSCGFCAIPSFRGRQRSRSPEAVLAEVEALVGAGVREVVLVAQDLASYGRDRADLGAGAIVPLVEAVAERAAWTRLLYLYPSDLDDRLVDVVAGVGRVPYFDLSLQHVSKRLLRRMRRWGEGDRFLERVEAIRRRHPGAALRSSFIVGYPGETEDDHQQLLDWIEAAQLDWVGLFGYSEEEGTHAADLDGKVPALLAAERLAEVRALQDDITTVRRAALVGTVDQVLVDAPGVARSTREAPEIDGVVLVPDHLAVGEFARVRITGAAGYDLVGEPE